MDYSDIQIQKFINSYKNNREYQKKYYRDRYNNDDTYREKQKQISRNYYKKNKEIRKEKYQKQKSFLQAKRRFSYWNKKNDLETFIKKYPEDYELYFKDNHL